MKSIILARVSTEEQKEAGNSLPAQIARLKTYCEQKKFQIIKTYSFDESAYKTKRDDFDKILDYLKSNKEKIAVCFDKVDRFSRNVFDKRVAYLYELAMKDQIELHFASDNLSITSNISAVEKFHFGINLGLSKYYSDAISDNVKRAYEQKIRNGEWVGKAPIGYKNIGEEKNKDVIPDPERAFYIVKIFEIYASGNGSMRTIKAEMDKSGLKSNTKNPKPITISQVDHILRNPFYYGIMRIKGKLYPHKYQPLISKELFDKVQEVRFGYHKKPFKYASKPYIFRGLIKCSNPACNCTITAEKAKGHIYYSCTNYKRIHDKRIYVKENDLLTPIRNVLKSIRLSDKNIHDLTEELRKVNQSKNEFHRQAMNSLRKEYDKFENRINNMVDARLDGSITTDIYDKKFKEYKEEQREIIEEMQRHNFADENYYIAINQVLSLAQRAYEIFESSELNEKRQLLNYLLQNCHLEGKNLLFTMKKPFDALVSYSECSNWLRG